MIPLRVVLSCSPYFVEFYILSNQIASKILLLLCLCRSRFLECLRISESYQGLSLGRIVTSLCGMDKLTNSMNLSVNNSHESFTEPTVRHS